MESHMSIPVSAFAGSRTFAVSLVCCVIFNFFVPDIAFALSTSTPDSMTLTADSDVIFKGGDTTVIIARVTSNGMPYNGCPVTFTVDRGDIAYTPMRNTNVTSPNGETMIYLTSTDLPGIVTVTAEAKLPDSTSTITATITVRVLDWGAIGGTIFNRTYAPMPGALVTLKDESGNPYPVQENPQNSSGHITPIGSFVYYRIPVGKYVLSWEAAGMSGSLPFTVSQGTATVIFNENRSLLFPGYADAPAGQTTLYGYVLDRLKNGVPAARVELYNTMYNSSGDCWDTLAPIAQTMTNSSFNYSGLYSFSNVPYGTYKVVANKMDAAGNNRSYYSIVTLNSSGYVAYIVIPSLGHHPTPATPTPVATSVGQTMLAVTSVPTLAPTPVPVAGNATAMQTDPGKAVLVMACIIAGVVLLLFVIRLTSRR